jgi:hypothetical protein
VAILGVVADDEIVQILAAERFTRGSDSPSDLVIELTTPGLQSLRKLFFGGQRQLILAREDLVPQVA